MRRINAKIILIAGILIQSVYAVQARQEGFYLLTSPENSLSKLDSQVLGTTLVRNQNLNRLITPKAKSVQTSDNLSSKVPPSLLENSSFQLASNNLHTQNKASSVQIKEFRPLTISDIERIVELNNPILIAAKSQVKQYKSLLLAEISSWYPTLNLTANGLPQYLETETYRNPDFATTSYNQDTNRSEPLTDSYSKQWKASVALQVKWNLIDPARVPAIASARDSYEKAQASYLIQLRDIRLSALRKYFLLQKANEGVRIGKESVKASLMSLKDAKARYESGLSTTLEVLEAETQLARDNQLLTNKIGNQKITRRSLARTLNMDEQVTPTAASPTMVVGAWIPSLEESINAAFNYREEINQAELDISISNNEANKSLASSQPIISIVNTLSASRYQGQQNIFTPSKVDMDDYGWSISNTIGLNANWSLFDGGRSKALYRYNKQKSQQAQANLEIKRDLIREEVEESFFNLETASQDIATTTREVIASRESLRLARLRFKAGVSTQREVVNNQRDLTQAEVRYTDAVTNYNISLSQLRRRTGIDLIRSCDSTNIYYKNKEKDDSNFIPIEPSPLIPACQASVIESKNERL